MFLNLAFLFCLMIVSSTVIKFIQLKSIIYLHEQIHQKNGRQGIIQSNISQLPDLFTAGNCVCNPLALHKTNLSPVYL